MKIVMVGAGGLHGQYCLDILRKSHCFEIAGVCDSVLEIGSNIHGLEVLGRQEQLPELAERHLIEGCVISLGDNFERYNVYRQLKALLPSLVFVNAIHPSAAIGEGVSLGVGVVIGPNAVIGPGTLVEDFVHIGSSTVVGVRNTLCRFASLSNSVVTGGLTQFKDFSAVALGSVVTDRLSIGVNTVIGSASLVMGDLPDDVLAYGSPARVVRARARGERFLR